MMHPTWKFEAGVVLTLNRRIKRMQKSKNAETKYWKSDEFRTEFLWEQGYRKIDMNYEDKLIATPAALL